MASSQPDDRFLLLATRVITGEASDKEREELNRLTIESPACRERYLKMCEGWNRDPSTASDTSFLFDTEPALDRLWGTIKERNTTPSGAHNVTSQNPSGSESYSCTETTSGSGTSNRRVRSSWRPRLLAAAVLLACLAGAYYSAYFHWEQPVEAVYATSDVEQRIISLPDGSTVRLNHNSRMELQFNEHSGERLVRLEGEAFFSIQHDPDRPFRVRVGESEVRVHGTSFNVKEGESLLVAVDEGVVSVHNEMFNREDGVRLHAGQLGLLMSSGTDFRIENGDVSNYLGWVNGYLNFDDMPFPRVVLQLERIFGVESVLDDPALEEIRLSVYADRMQLTEVLQTIAMTLDLTYTREGGTIRWNFDKT